MRKEAARTKQASAVRDAKSISYLIGQTDGYSEGYAEGWGDGRLATSGNAIVWIAVGVTLEFVIVLLANAL